MGQADAEVSPVGRGKSEGLQGGEDAVGEGQWRGEEGSELELEEHEVRRC